MKDSRFPGPGQIATQPFGDIGEVPPVFDPTPVPDVYREFLPTDARTVMIVIHPNHYNFFINPAMREDSTGWERTQYLLETAAWHVDASKVRADGLALTDITGNGRDAVLGTTTGKPEILPYTGKPYLYLPQNTLNVNYAGLSTATFAPTDTVEFEVEQVGLDANTTYALYTTVTTNSAFLIYFNAGNVIYRLKWGGGNQDHTWAARQTGKHTYRFVRTTTTVELFVDGVSKGVKTFAQAVGPTTQAINVGRVGTSPSTEKPKYYSFSLGDVAVLDPANHHTSYTKIRNSGVAGGDWVIVRAATGWKAALVDRPLLLFGGPQFFTATSPPPSKQATMLMAVRAHSNMSARGYGLGVGAWNTGFHSYWDNGTAITHYCKTTYTGQEQWGINVVIGCRLGDGAITTYPSKAITTAPGFGSSLLWGVSDKVHLNAPPPQGNGTGNEFEFIGAALFDRALTNDEVALASKELAASAISNALDDDLDPDDSWVGQSIPFDGTGYIRFRDEDGDGNPAFVYVGPSQDSQMLDWYEPGRSAATWTFSAYLRGGTAKDSSPGMPPPRARLLMRAYAPEEQGKHLSPPQYADLPISTDPSKETYGLPAIAGPDGVVWTRREPPFYEYLDKPPVSATNPTSILSTGPMPPVGKNPFLMYNNRLYGLKDPYPETAGQALYEDLGDPTEATDPATSLPTQTYLIVYGTDTDKDGQVWKMIPQPVYESTGQQEWFDRVEGPWIELKDDGEWKRLMIRTDAYASEDGGRVSFQGVAWIDAVVQLENVSGVKVSALMLDPNENPVAQYFDGAMEPEPNLDDFLWSQVDYTTQVPLENQCISYYYYDLRSRVKWLWDNLKFVVPVGRPYQIFFGAYDRPYLPQGQGTSSAAAATTVIVGELGL